MSNLRRYSDDVASYLRGLDYASERFRELYHWVVALNAFDHGDRQVLAKLITKEEVPPEFRSRVADIVSGIRKPKAKAAAKLKIPASQRMRLAAIVCRQLDDINRILTSYVSVEGESLSAELAKEPSQVRREYQARARAIVQHIARQSRVSTKTIESLVREFRKLVRDFPNI